MSRQEQPGMDDLRAMKRHQRTNEILAAKAKKTKRTQPADLPETDSLVISVGPGVCTIAVDGASEQRLVHTDVTVAPGDRVAIRHEKVAAIAPRRTTLSRTDPVNPRRERIIAANIDTLVIVAATADPPFRPGLVDRYLVAATRGGIQPILCVTKIDLDPDTRAAETYREAGVPVIRCSTATNTGIYELRDLLAGNLAVLAGHSGVGKSSLLNALTREATARTGSVSAETGKGTHTTTSSRLYELKNGARIIDTPGIRMFEPGVVTYEQLFAAFPEFAEFPCRFRDCHHRNEPGCGVISAVESAQIQHGRYASYLKLSASV